MTRTRFWLPALALLLLTGLTGIALGFPQPSPYPVSWEVSFTHELPKRIVVQVPGEAQPQAFYYMAYTVINDTDREQTFLPVFTLVTKAGDAIHSDRNISPKVFDAIKKRAGDPHLQDIFQIAGALRVGEDQQKHGVAIWKEPAKRMGSFQIYVEGLSGETAKVMDAKGQPIKGADGQPITLFKTKQLDFTVYGDEIAPQNDSVRQEGESWVMR